MEGSGAYWIIHTLRCSFSAIEVAAPLTMTLPELLLQCLNRFFDPSKWYSRRLGKFLRVKRELRLHIACCASTFLLVYVMRRLPLLSLWTVKLLLFIALRALDGISMLLRPFKVRHGQTMPLTILPSHVHEFFLVSKHVFFVKFVDLHKFYMAKPLVPGMIHLPDPVTLEYATHANSDCFRSIFADIWL